MRQNPSRLLSVAKRSLLGCSAAFLVVLAFNVNVRAATPLPVNIYQDMESGNDSDLLTPTIMNASSHGNQAWKWLGKSQMMWVATGHSNNLPGPVTVGGATYNGTGGTRSWAMNDNLDYTAVCCTFSPPASALGVTVACYYTPGLNQVIYHELDTLRLISPGKGWGVLETGITGKGVTVINSHSANPAGITTRGPYINVVAGHTYWVNLHFDTAGSCSAAVFDPANGFAQVGSVSTCDGQPGALMKEADFGRGDAVGKDKVTSQSYFDQIVIDYTNGVFPLIPGATDTTPPSAPPVVRNGTGADMATTGSLVTLSANWDAGSDAESGIFGYRYAIGTTPGGTDVVNWKYVGNVTTVTQPYLSLTLGKTYYFSVKAVSGAGLLSAATISKGQTVVPDLTPPSAPPVVRHTLWGLGDKNVSTTTSTTQLSASWDASTDAESGIGCYQYAIGTTPGGTDTADWTSTQIHDVLFVVRTKLSLTVGQTYYFSVRAVNGAGLVGPATNSSGVTVVDKTPPPSAPPAVRDGK